MDGLEKERDFYFDKLRDIEILLQDIEDQGTGSGDHIASIFKILYATAEGFEPIDESALAGAAAPALGVDVDGFDAAEGGGPSSEAYVEEGNPRSYAYDDEIPGNNLVSTEDEEVDDSETF